ncbi:prostaglandin E2 receptor EP2 subtype isoform X1 [Cataglyphis hispanica]|uniref:prostaglandin E2 receptor EP2 subtype isoform X1 n=1 Tax=Cataglyphis hispanica TaxID=1086592 RepID=UPI002180743F|nr:prostaglandin E2 receptor EP2 subtype isoform X1 [Cataglyphis hispanica]XP_050450003.1 prostaglandin E2 receptor EP2 subtype isoform X1 [Cataglyphis hispanica]XP_050450013.1 prostaglandin E2 receptor EP2 subtype isoform X1 [Cataglyphis hispanica]
MIADNLQNYTLSTLFTKTTMMPDAIASVVPKRHVTLVSQVVLTLVYITGVIGNVSALVILFHRDKRRNRKHLLMLRCLATNDLVALLGMLVQMYVTIYIGNVMSMRIFCSLRVVWRLFGLFSGCVAIVMAAERWLALTRPFVYQKQVTYPVIVRCMLALWLVALAMTSLPVMGFGLYYKSERCVRYREATEPSDIAYAYVWFVFGTLLCLSIVWCNLAVSRALSRISRRAGSLRRICRASSRAKPLLTIAGPPNRVEVATIEEKAFARLMAVLSISFVICWMPHMISIPLAQFAMRLPQTATTIRKFIQIFQIVADILLCIHFTLDPYIYVLLRVPRPRFRLLKPLCRICWPDRSRSNSFTGTIDHQCSSGDPPTPITEAPSTPVSEEHDSHLVMASASF